MGFSMVLVSSLLFSSLLFSSLLFSSLLFSSLLFSSLLFSSLLFSSLLFSSLLFSSLLFSSLLFMCKGFKSQPFFKPTDIDSDRHAISFNWVLFHIPEFLSWSCISTQVPKREKWPRDWMALCVECVSCVYGVYLCVHVCDIEKDRKRLGW